MEPCKEAYLKAREKRFNLHSKIELSTVYGKRSQPRNKDPSIGDLLKWKDEKEEIWNYKTDNKKVIRDNPFDKIQKCIDPSKNNWISETQDAYKGFFKLNDHVYDVVDPNKALPFSCDSCNSGRKSRSTSTKRKNRKHNHFDENALHHSHSKEYVKAKKAKKQKINKDTEERLKIFNAQTRWLPNTSMTTYYGKTPFDNYGMANTKSKLDGFLYGNYMKSFNVNPHRGDNFPENYQTFNNSLLTLENKDLRPEPPRKVMELYRLTDEQVKELNSRNPLYPEKNGFESQYIQKPNLKKTRRFNPEYHEHRIKKRQLKERSKKNEISHDRSKTYSRSKSQKRINQKNLSKNDKMKQKVRIQEEEKAGFLNSKGINDPSDREYNVKEYLEAKRVNENKFTDKITSNNNFRNDKGSNTQALSKNELNPKYYKGDQAKNLNQIPYAGKYNLKEDKKNILYHDELSRFK